MGNSLGGMVAQELALRHAGRVRSLVLVATSPGIGSVPSHPALAWHLWRATRSEGTRRRHHLDRAFHGPASVLDAPERLRRDPDDDPMPHGRGPWRQLAAALRWSALRPTSWTDPPSPERVSMPRVRGASSTTSASWPATSEA